MKKLNPSTKDDSKKDPKSSDKKNLSENNTREDNSYQKKSINRTDRIFSMYTHRKEYSSETKPETSIISKYSKNTENYKNSDSTKQIESKSDVRYEPRKEFRFEKATYQGHTVFKCSETNRNIRPTKHFKVQDSLKTNRSSLNEQKEETPQISAADIWKNAAKILDSKKIVKKPPVKPTLEKKVEKINLSHAQIAEALRHSILNRATIPSLISKKPKNPKIPDFFPKDPIHIFDGPGVYKHLNIDTLFFIFYFSRDERQISSARELKKYSWRYHTKYNTWFQRLEEPKMITEYYEQGIFLFFDFEVTWTNRKKKDFTFEYKYLENIEI